MKLKFRVGLLMNERQVTEGELAKRAKVTRNTVRALQRGTNRRVDLDVLEKVAGALSVRPLELLEEVPGNTKPAHSVPA